MSLSLNVTGPVSLAARVQMDSPDVAAQIARMRRFDELAIASDRADLTIALAASGDTLDKLAKIAVAAVAYRQPE